MNRTKNYSFPMNLMLEIFGTSMPEAIPDDINETFEQIFNEMKPRQATILKALYVEGKTMKETGQLVNVSPGTVSQLLHISLRWLRRPPYSKMLKLGLRNYTSLIQQIEAEKKAEVLHREQMEQDRIQDLHTSLGDKIAVAILQYERDFPSRSVGYLDLSAHSYNILHKNGLTDIISLCSITEKELRKVQGCGKLSVIDIENALEYKGLSLKFGHTLNKDSLKLIPCPECNTIPIMHTVKTPDKQYAYKYLCTTSDVHCNCGDWKESRESALVDWNRRAGEQLAYSPCVCSNYERWRDAFMTYYPYIPVSAQISKDGLLKAQFCPRCGKLL